MDDPRPPLEDGGSSGKADFEREMHIRYLEMMYDCLPKVYESEEINHLTLAYFVISGLDILGALDRVDKDQVVNWVFSFQKHPLDKDEANNGQFYGFHGSRTSQFPANTLEVSHHNGSHLASTYSALSILKIVGYDLSNFDSSILIKSMRNLQQPDGSFMPIHIGGEADLRFVYCAAAISSMLNNWNGMDMQHTKDYTLRCQSYDGGFGLVPGSESHGGATYCAVAALQLMGFIKTNPLSVCADPLEFDIRSVVDWALQLQGTDGGFRGRTNKPSDTCYAFWVGGVLKMLGAYDFVDRVSLERFLFSCQSQKYGGFKKFSHNKLPDLYHSYFGFSAFSLLGACDTKPLCIELGITASECDLNDNH